MPSSPVPCVVLRPPGAPPYVVTLERLTALVRASRVLRMGRLAGILAKASEARAGLETVVEKNVAGYIERVNSAHVRVDAVFMQKHVELDGHVSDLAEFERDIEAFGKNDQSHVGENGSAYVGTGGKQ